MATTQYGSPDWQKQVQSRTGNLFVSGSQSIPTGTVYTGVLALQSWPGIMLRVKPSAGYGQVNISFYGDSGKADFIGGYTWDVNSNVGLFVMLPSFGPYMEVWIKAQSVTDLVATTHLFGVTNAPVSIYYPNTQDGVYAYGVPVAAGASDDHYPGWIQKGLAWLLFNPGVNGPSLEFQVDAIDGSGAILYNVIIYYEVSGQQSGLIAVPDVPIRVRCTNLSTTGPLTYSFALVTQGTT